MTESTDKPKRKNRWLLISFLCGSVPGFTILTACSLHEIYVAKKSFFEDLYPRDFYVALIAAVTLGAVAILLTYIGVQIKERGLFR